MMSQTAKVLLLYAHPESQDSVANRVLLKPAKQLHNVTVHDLYAHYPDFFIDIPGNRHCCASMRSLFSSIRFIPTALPGAAKEWFDRVLTREFASGPAGSQLRESTGVVLSPPASRRRLSP
jgi:glutathione-regulated potassium-efflux system ancillary protein KefG